MTKRIDAILGETPIEPAADLDGSVPDSRRPALRRLTLDVEELVSSLERGFDGRAGILRWARSSITRTLGEIATDWYRELGSQFRGVPDRAGERVLLEGMLIDSERTHDLDDEAVDELRRRIAVEVIEPAYHAAYRSLRADATEYVDDDNSADSDTNPAKQSFIAMRPYLDEIDEYQEIAVAALLAGLDDAGEIRRWVAILEHGTHGELPDRFASRCLREPSTRTLLLEDDPTPAQQRARELFAAFHLLPRFNAGVRDLRGRSKEEVSPDQSRLEAHFA